MSVAKAGDAENNANTAFELSLEQWIRETCSRNESIDDRIVLQHANKLAPEVGVTGKVYSEGWLHKFKRRLGIKYTATTGSTPGATGADTASATLQRDGNDCVPQESKSKSKNKSSKSNKKKKKTKKKDADYDSEEEPLIYIKQEKDDQPVRRHNPKRKRIQLTISEKIEVLKKMAKGISDEDLIREYEVGRTTLFDIKKKKKLILDYYRRRKESRDINSKKSMRSAKWPELDFKIFQWYIDKRKVGETVSDEEIITRARELHSELEILEEFLFSPTWLKNFKMRNRLQYLEKVTDGYTKNLEKIDETPTEFEEEEALLNEAESTLLAVKRRRKTSVNRKPIVRNKLNRDRHSSGGYTPKPIVVRSSLDQELKPIVMQLNNYIYCQSENDIFGRYVSCQLENMAPTNRCTAQERIQAILTHFKLQALSRPEEETEITA